MSVEEDGGRKLILQGVSQRKQGSEGLGMGRKKEEGLFRAGKG